MKMVLHLAESAQVANGKVYALGLGWNGLVLPVPPMSVVALMDVEWSSQPTEFDVMFDLVDADAKPVMLPGPSGPEPLRALVHARCVHNQAVPGVPTRIPLVVNFPPGLPLRPGMRYQWRATVEGEMLADQSFTVSAPPNA